jgi:chlorite dismutase
MSEENLIEALAASQAALREAQDRLTSEQASNDEYKRLLKEAQEEIKHWRESESEKRERVIALEIRAEKAEVDLALEKKRADDNREHAEEFRRELKLAVAVVEAVKKIVRGGQ